MQDLISHLPAVIYEYWIYPDGKRRLAFVSDSSKNVLGVAAPTIMDDPGGLERFVHGDDLSDWQETSAASEQPGAVWHWQGRLTIEQRIIWVEVNATHQGHDDGVVIRRGIIQNITKRKERDLSERKRTETRIKKNETLSNQLFQNIPMAVVLLSEAGKVEQVNKGFEEMFGYSLSELKNRSINDFIVPEQLTHEGVDLNNLIASHRVVSIETVRRHRSGRIVDVILYGMPIKLENQTIGIYGVYVDITERKRVEEELKIRNAELDNFVYKVSHDLRAPLSSILGLVNLAKLPGNTDNPMDYIEIIGSKVEHLDHFIGDVLSHSKNLKMEVSIAKVDFSHIIDETFNDLSYLEGAKGISRHIKIDGIDFYSDPWRIAEILRNLISNAIKYRKLDEPHQEIAIRINVDHLRAEITFADNGIGIEEQNLTKVFEMFYRATEQSDGSGIGLYIVKNAVDKIGGQISVGSRLGHGTRFTIILPNRINSVINQMPASIGVEQQ